MVKWAFNEIDILQEEFLLDHPNMYDKSNKTGLDLQLIYKWKFECAEKTLLKLIVK